MLEFLSSISNAISTAITFLLDTVTNFFSVLSLIPQGIAFLLSLAAMLPPAVTVFATLGIVVCVMFLIVGR